MKKYIGKRVLTSLFTLLAILLVLFILMQLMPGSPFNDEKLNEEQRIALYTKYGLDQPIVVQFFKYVGNMLKGDLGVSYNISKNTPISQLIQTRLPISIRIGGCAVGLGAVVGLILGLIAALKHDTIWDSLATVISVIGVSVPSYVFALALSYNFGFKLGWFPMLFSQQDIFGSSVLPSVSLSMFTMASIARFTRSEMLEVLGSDYMLLAESKGISGAQECVDSHNYGFGAADCRLDDRVACGGKDFRHSGCWKSACDGYSVKRLQCGYRAELYLFGNVYRYYACG